MNTSIQLAKTGVMKLRPIRWNNEERETERNKTDSYINWEE